MLKNILAASLLAPLIVCAQSTVNLSGGFVTGYKHTPGKSDGTPSKNALDNLEAAGSHLTLRAVEDLGNGYKVNILLNHRFDPSTGGQTGNTFFTNSKIGLAGGFGEISMGKMWGPVDELLRRALDVYMPLGLGTTVYGGPGDAPTRYNGTLMYLSPDFTGLRVAAAVVPKGNMASNRQNTTELAVRYKTAGLTLGLGYTQNAGNVPSAADNFKDRNVLTVGGRYDFEAFDVGLTYSRVSSPRPEQKLDRYSLGARYRLSPSWSLKFGYEFAQVNHSERTNTVAAGAEYKLSRRTMLFTEVGHAQSDNRAKDDRGATLMLGIAHKF